MNVKILLPLCLLFCASVFAQEAKPKIIAIAFKKKKTTGNTGRTGK
jgi:hypothetical protein